jgi:uncharacterized flavoprotein (TIGR03862 family)
MNTSDPAAAAARASPPALPVALCDAAVVIGGGPAGLMAAEALLAAGCRVYLLDAMPSVGRKFLLAGKGGLNLTHSEPFALFVERYAERAAALQPWLQAFDADALRAWAAALGVATFVGSSGRVFPVDFKAAPLLRAWLYRLRGQGLQVHVRHRWLGWDDDGALRVATPQGLRALRPGAVVLALGGASWPQLGSDGAWAPWLQAAGATVSPLRPANCGFLAAWSPHLRQHHAGAPLKAVALQFEGWRQVGECVLSDDGLEGQLVYAASGRLRAAIDRDGHASFHFDLLPQRSADEVLREVAHPRGAKSWASHLKSRLKLDGAKAALLWEVLPRPVPDDPARIAATIKALPVTVTAPRPLAEAISTAGGVCFDALDEHLMLRPRPGVFCAGEMLDWEAPTGGYLLQASFATGRAAGQGAAAWLRRGVQAPAGAGEGGA